MSLLMISKMESPRFVVRGNMLVVVKL
jgi:hypothetical protein